MDLEDDNDSDELPEQDDLDDEISDSVIRDEPVELKGHFSDSSGDVVMASASGSPQHVETPRSLKDLPARTPTNTAPRAGQLYLFGAGMFSLLAGIHGDDEDKHAFAPTPAPTLTSTKIAAVHLASSHALAVTANGELLSWGTGNNFGQLGRPLAADSGESARPQAIGALDTKVIRLLTAGLNHSVVVDDTGALAGPRCDCSC